MDENRVIYTDEFLQITAKNSELYIETYIKGFPFERFKTILHTYHQIDIQNFNVVKNALQTAPRPPERFGRLKEDLVVEITENGMTAYITFNLPPEALAFDNRGSIISMVSSKLKEKGIVFGIKKDLFLHDLVAGKQYIIAEGIPPENGEDSKITMFVQKEARPEIMEDGSVDYYELSLINRVKRGDWLGERLDPTPGNAGTNVKGESIPPVKGKTIPLSFDRNSVIELSMNGITTLYSKINGAVNYTDGKIGVSNHLEIDGDVDFKTGNIKFDGYVTIKGTVADGFHVEATNDIEINSQFGLGNVRGIVSTKGSIYIRGGIAAKSRVEILAARNIFAKFVDNASLVCNEKVHIGFYSINSDIQAAEVIIDSPNGQIIGGSVTAHVRVISPCLGSDAEKRTVIHVTGFDRNGLKLELENIFKTLIELKTEQQNLKLLVSRFASMEELNAFQKKDYNEALDRMYEIKNEIRTTEDRRKTIGDYLKTHGEGEIVVSKKIYPKCLLILKNNRMEITSLSGSITYYIEGEEIKQIQ